MNEIPKIDEIRLFRMVHLDNLAHILKHGMVIKTHPKTMVGYKSIGDSELIGQRNERDVTVIPPNGKRNVTNGVLQTVMRKAILVLFTTA